MMVDMIQKQLLEEIADLHQPLQSFFIILVKHRSASLLMQRQRPGLPHPLEEASFRRGYFFLGIVIDRVIAGDIRPITVIEAKADRIIGRIRAR